jgi:hypothetical protein
MFLRCSAFGAVQGSENVYDDIGCGYLSGVNTIVPLSKRLKYSFSSFKSYKLGKLSAQVAGNTITDMVVLVQCPSLYPFYLESRNILKNFRSLL